MPIYKADIAGGSLKVYETRIIAGLLLEKLSPEAWCQAIEIDNVLQKKSPNTARRQASLIKARLQTMTEDLWVLVRDGNKPVATQAVFASAIAHSRLLADFLDLEVRDRIRGGTPELTRAHWHAFVEACRDRDAEMTDWSASTRAKLGDSVFQILTEVGLLSTGPSPHLQPVLYAPEVTSYLKKSGFLNVLRAMQVFT